MEEEKTKPAGAGNESGDSKGQCPIPSTHDKLSEAHYFIHEMVADYHQPDAFRYSLSGFLQAARSTTLMLQTELANRPGFDEWYAPHRLKMKDDSDLRLLNDLRVRVVHKSSLIPASTMFIGYMKYRRPAGGLMMPFDPMTQTVVALVEARRHFADWVHPHRIWIGEELGVQRKWSLQEIGERELIKFCQDCWNKLSSVVANAHIWAGVTLKRTKCERELGDAQLLTESEVFPEVAKAWDGSPTDLVTPREKELPLLEEPMVEAKCLYTLSAPNAAKGWVTAKPRYWSPRYASMLVYSIGDDLLKASNCVFFELSKAVLSKAPEEEDAPSEADNSPA